MDTTHQAKRDEPINEHDTQASVCARGQCWAVIGSGLLAAAIAALGVQAEEATASPPSPQRTETAITPP